MGRGTKNVKNHCNRAKNEKRGWIRLSAVIFPDPKLELHFMEFRGKEQLDCCLFILTVKRSSRRTRGMWCLIRIYSCVSITSDCNRCHYILTDPYSGCLCIAMKLDIGMMEKTLVRSWLNCLEVET